MTLITTGSEYLNMNSDCEYHIESKSRTGGLEVGIHLSDFVNENVLLFPEKVCPSQKNTKFENKISYGNNRNFRTSNSEKSWYSSLYVLYSFHVWGLEGRQVWHFRCKKRKLIYCRWHSVPKVPVMPAHCFQARKWFHNANAQEGELSREPALHKISKFLALATAW